MPRYSIRCPSLRTRRVVIADNENIALDYVRNLYNLPDNHHLKIRKSSTHRKLNFIKNDGGRQAAGFNEKLDCTVRAVAIALNMSYSSAHSLLTAYGRKDRHCYNLGWFLSHGMGQWLAEDYSTTCHTLGQFVQAHPKGTFICVTRKHAMAVIDGVIHDTFCTGGKSKLEQVWPPIAY